jgi:hypothetical protein
MELTMQNAQFRVECEAGWKNLDKGEREHKTWTAMKVCFLMGKATSKKTPSIAYALILGVCILLRV